MYTISLSSSSSISTITQSNSSHPSSHRVLGPSQIIITCVSRNREGHYPPTFCSIIAGKVTSLQQNDSDVTARSNMDLVTVPGSTLLHTAKYQKTLSFADMSPASKYSEQIRVAYQGVSGAYSETAAMKAYPESEAIACDQFDVVFRAVENFIADRAVLPVENSLGGSIHRNYDLLLGHRLHIVGEIQLPIHHCLLGLQGVRKEDIHRVISHQQALSQCENTLTQMGLGPNFIRESVYNTAFAAAYIAENNLRDTAAIASSRAAQLYGLQIMGDGIHDDPGNVTRFMILAREPLIPRADRPYKTSMVFANENEGVINLFKVLSAFAFRNISVTKIESRPHRRRPIRLIDGGGMGMKKHFEYIFYVDFEASMAEERAQNAVAEVQEFTSFLRLLGSYPMDMTPWSPSTSIT